MRQEGKCQYCGERQGSMHSGVLECDVCWTWRKLDGPANVHWLKVTAEFLSNVDLHDRDTYLPETMGLTKEEVGDFLEKAHKLLDGTVRRALEHRREVPENVLKWYEEKHGA